MNNCIQALDAALTIKTECKSRKDCEGCPFFEQTSCILRGTKYPSDWPVLERVAHDR